MDINSYEALVVIETMREYGAPLSTLSTVTGLPENKLKYYCQREDIGICWIAVYLCIIRREDTGRKFSMESLLEKETMQFCRRRNAAFWRDVDRCGFIDVLQEFFIADLPAEIVDCDIIRIILVILPQIFVDRALRQRGIDRRFGIVFKPGLINRRIAGQFLFIAHSAAPCPGLYYQKVYLLTADKSQILYTENIFISREKRIITGCSLFSLINCGHIKR